MYNTKQLLMARLLFLRCGVWCTLLLPLSSDSLLHGVAVLVRDSSMGQIDHLKNYSGLIGPLKKEKNPYKKKTKTKKILRNNYSKM